MKPTHILIFSEDPNIFSEFASLLPSAYTATHITESSELLTYPEQDICAVLALSVHKNLEFLYQHSDRISPIIISQETPTTEQMNELLRVRPQAFIEYPFIPEQVLKVLADVSNRQSPMQSPSHIPEDQSEINRRLNQRLQEINTIYTVGKFVAASLEVDEVLERIVGASVNLTQAEEGFILLKENNQLYLRISKSMKATIAESFHVQTSDSIAWQVIRSGRPTMLHRDTKIATGGVAQSLLYVPLQAPGRGTIGILGVVNMSKEQTFTENHLFTLSSVADFAAIALENARLFGAVEKEKSRLSAVLEHAAEAIMVTDTNNCLLIWSGTAAKAFNIKPDAQGQSIERCIKHAAIRELFYRANEGESLLHAEVTLENGQVFNTQLSNVRNVGRVVIMQDITHLKELDRLKSEFVSTVSHDLRTPLTTVQGYIELLNRVGPLTDMQTNFIDKALTSLTHITALIGDLLDIGRIEAGYDLEMRPMRMDEVIQQVMEVYSLIAEQQEIALQIDLAEQPLWLQGNARRIRQVIENLVSNAIKYNRPGGWVKVIATPDNQHIIVRVEDNGIGIPLKEQPKIFERFYRVQSPETEDIYGTGLGLAIVKSVIEKHKGRAWVESAPGEGSIFAFIVSACQEPKGD